MPEIVKHEIRSPEMQEVMSAIPGSFLKWGLFLFLAIILAILGVTWFINYPNIVTVPVTITTYNSPASLVAKAGGKIEKLIVNNGDNVSTKQTVALIENTARFEDVRLLETFLDTLKKNPDWQQNVLKNDLPASLSVGEIQTGYSRFITVFQQFKDYQKNLGDVFEYLLVNKDSPAFKEYQTKNNKANLSAESLENTSRKIRTDDFSYEDLP